MTRTLDTERERRQSRPGGSCLAGTPQAFGNLLLEVSELEFSLLGILTPTQAPWWQAQPHDVPSTWGAHARGADPPVETEALAQVSNDSKPETKPPLCALCEHCSWWLSGLR